VARTLNISSVPSVARTLNISSGLNSFGGKARGALGSREGDNVSRVKQVFEGLKLVHRKVNRPVVLIAENWPSLGLDLASMMGQHLYIHAPGLDPAFRSIFEGNIRWVTSDQEAIRLLGVAENIRIWQGSVAFLKPWMSHLWTTRSFDSILLLPSGRQRRKSVELASLGLRWATLKHSELGGVTKSVWALGISASSNVSFDWNRLSCSHGLTRPLSDVIKDGNPGVRVLAPSKEDEELLRSSVRISALLKESWIVPSFKVSSGWVRRPLTDAEIASAYDIPELVAKKVLQIKVVDKALPFLYSAPGKVSQVVSTLVANLWGESEDIPGSQSVVPRPIPAAQGVLLENPNRLVGGISERDDASNIANAQRAVREDDARVPVELWDQQVFRRDGPFGHIDYRPAVHGQLMAKVREELAMKVYGRNLSKSFFMYMRKAHGDDWAAQVKYTAPDRKVSRKRKRGRDLAASKQKEIEKDLLLIGLEGVARAVQSSWWDWSKGSTPFFWRWPKDIRKEVRDGVPVFVEGQLPQRKSKQRLRCEQEVKAAMKRKLEKVLGRGYLVKGYVLSLTNYFAVPKGENDIRMVYDGTMSGLNEAVWAPNFFMPSVDSVLMFCDADSWFSDMDLGEMFLNYFMDEKIRPYSGVDLSEINGNKLQRDWVRWERTFMGFRSSPYNAAKLFGWTMDVIRGDRFDVNNPYRWNKVRCNYPGASGYDPAKAWVVKMNGDVPAGDLEAYCDDVRHWGPSEITCRRAGRRASQITQYLGQQDAARKTRHPSKVPGPWCGSFFSAADGCLWVYVSDEKWKKAQCLLQHLLQELDASKDNSLEHKPLEKARGFLVYLSRTYPTITPFLKGIHLTLDSWRPGRDTDGWKMKRNKEVPQYSSEDPLDDMDGQLLQDGDGDWQFIPAVDNPMGPPPPKVKAVPRLLHDLNALWTFFQVDTPPWRYVRGKRVCVVRYGFGDASKGGFGASFEGTQGIWYRLGVWGSDSSDDSSNFRELCNLVEALEAQGQSGELNGVEVFMFTDNQVAEGAFYKGTSSNKKLFELVVRLRKLEFHTGCLIHLIHVAGTRMIAQGTDGLSRGDTGEGVMKGQTMLSFVPLHLSCLTRSAKLQDWLTSTFGGKESLEFLSEDGWFHRGHDFERGGLRNLDGVWMPHFRSGTFVWTPPPAGGQVAVEQLRRARVKRQSSTHIVVLPRLFTSIWRKQLYKVADLLIEIPFIDGIWDKDEQHEPLTLAFVFPFLSFSPWQLKRSASFLGMGRFLRGLWEQETFPTGFVLREFFQWARNLATLSEGVVCKMLRSPEESGLLHTSGGQRAKRGRFGLEEEQTKHPKLFKRN